MTRPTPGNRAAAAAVCALLWLLAAGCGGGSAGESQATPAEQQATPAEQHAAQALKDYVTAQLAWHEANGRYTYELEVLEGLPPGMAAASSPDSGYHGYYFTQVELNGSVPMNYEHEFVLCAVPCEYGVSGTRTFAIGPKGIVLANDNGGKPVINATGFTGGAWKPE